MGIERYLNGIHKKLDVSWDWETPQGLPTWVLGFSAATGIELDWYGYRKS
tara:strand:+ start:1490 stop:1639 length:150 start_codon:yes stop_codon:yes gene_type:complete